MTEGHIEDQTWETILLYLEPSKKLLHQKNVMRKLQKKKNINQNRSLKFIQSCHFDIIRDACQYYCRLKLYNLTRNSSTL